MNAISIIRFVIFGIIFIFSSICLGISANLLAEAKKTLAEANEYYGEPNGFTSPLTSALIFTGCGLAAAILTLVISIPMFIIDLVRKGSHVSWVAVELGWTGLLWVLWLVSAALSTSKSTTLIPEGTCTDWWTVSVCSQYFALQAFQWLTWVFLFIYFVLVIILAIVASARGNSRAWLGPVSNLRFSSTGTNNAEPQLLPSGAYTLQPSYSTIPTPGAYGGQAGLPMQPVTYPTGSTGYAVSHPGSHPGSPAPTGQYQTPVHTGGYGAPGAPTVSTGYTGFHAVTPVPAGQYQTPVHTGGYGAPVATGYAQPGQYGVLYGQNLQPNPNVAQV